MKKMTVAVFMVSALAAASVFAYEITHPNLRDAVHKIDEALVHIHKAYEANGGKGAVFGGHAEEAEKSLERAKHEIEEADHYRNEHQGR